ncbi:hypothetical protein Bca4012_023804 [Brassica carinata]
MMNVPDIGQSSGSGASESDGTSEARSISLLQTRQFYHSRTLQISTDVTTETRASTLRCASLGGPSTLNGLSSSDESRGFSRRRSVMVFRFRSRCTSILLSSVKPSCRLGPNLSTAYGASFSKKHLISSSLRRLESHRSLCPVAPHLTGNRSITTTSSDPSLFGDASISPPSKVVFSFPLWYLFDDGTIPLRTDEHVDSKLVLMLLSASLSLLVWAWPRYGIFSVSPRSNLARPNCFRRICDPASYGAWVRASVSESSVSSPRFVLLRSSSSSEEKPLPPYTLPMARGAAPDLLRSVCYSFFIVLLSCGEVSTGPEDTSETTLVVLIDGVWTPTSLM